MKWHKISDGDYPEVGRCVLMSAKSSNKAYLENFCAVVWMEKLDDDKNYWIECEGYYGVKPTDRWAYIDLPTD